VSGPVPDPAQPGGAAPQGLLLVDTLHQPVGHPEARLVDREANTAGELTLQAALNDVDLLQVLRGKPGAHPVTQRLVACQQHESKRSRAERGIRRQKRLNPLNSPLDTGRVGTRPGTLRHPLQAINERRNALLLGGDRGHDRHLKDLRERFHVYVDAGAAGLIVHVEYQHERNAHFSKLEGDQQDPAKILHIADLDDGVVRALQEHVPGNLLVL
jgi:hypothetical protein